MILETISYRSQSLTCWLHTVLPCSDQPWTVAAEVLSLQSPTIPPRAPLLSLKEVRHSDQKLCKLIMKFTASGDHEIIPAELLNVASETSGSPCQVFAGEQGTDQWAFVRLSSISCWMMRWAALAVSTLRSVPHVSLRNCHCHLSIHADIKSHHNCSTALLLSKMAANLLLPHMA